MKSMSEIACDAINKAYEERIEKDKLERQKELGAEFIKGVEACEVRINNYWSENLKYSGTQREEFIFNDLIKELEALKTKEG